MNAETFLLTVGWVLVGIGIVFYSYLRLTRSRRASQEGEQEVSRVN